MAEEKPTNVRGISIFCLRLSLLAFVMSELAGIWSILSLFGCGRSVPKPDAVCGIYLFTLIVVPPPPTPPHPPFMRGITLARLEA